MSVIPPWAVSQIRGMVKASSTTTLTITDKEGVEHKGKYRVYRPSADDRKVFGNDEWELDMEAIWVACAANDDGSPSSPLPRGGIFEWSSSKWELSGIDASSTETTTVRSLAKLKERL